MPQRSPSFILLLLYCAFSCAPASADGNTNSVCHSRDQIVLASTRNYANVVGHVLDRDSFVGYVCHPDGSCSNQPVNLFAPHGFAETWIFVHGNQITAEMAIERGTRVYRSLRDRRCQQGYCHKGPIRFVIYSWPTKRDTIRLVDAAIKTKRTNAESFYFGDFLGAVAEHGPLNIVAYSFGARVACGGLHLLHGGSLDGYYLPRRAVPKTPIRVSMVAAAVESDGVLPGGRYERAMSSTDRLLLLNNSRDKALRLFWVIDRSRPKALGRAGLETALPNSFTTQYDWEQTFGQDHSIWNYFDRPIIVDRIIENFAR